MPLSESQKGEIGETLARLKLLIASDGRFTSFTPIVDDAGIDLIILDKPTSRLLLIQVKTKTRSSPSRPNVVKFEVSRRAIQVAPQGFLLGLLLDGDLQEARLAWLIPLSRVAESVMDSRDPIEVVASTVPTAADQWREFRVAGIRAVAERIVSELIIADTGNSVGV